MGAHLKCCTEARTAKEIVGLIKTVSLRFMVLEFFVAAPIEIEWRVSTLLTTFDWIPLGQSCRLGRILSKCRLPDPLQPGSVTQPSFKGAVDFEVARSPWTLTKTDSQKNL